MYLSDPPEAPRDFILEPSLTLEWTRPTNIPGPENVDVNYTITINSIDDGVPPMNYQNFTSMTLLSVLFLEEIISVQGSQCVEFEFIINATNDAGTGPSTRLIDTVPICKLIVYRRHCLLSACAYNTWQQGTVCLTKSMYLAGASHLIKRLNTR